MKTTQTTTSVSSKFRGILALTGILLGVLGAVSTPVSAASPGQVGTKAPALISGTWSVGKPTTLSSLKGKVVVLSFWTTQCINCRRTVPYWSKWIKENAKKDDLAVVTVHTPEWPSERGIKVSHDYATTHGLNVPVLVDNDRKNWDAFGIEAWPTTILIDKNGVIRGRWEGELNYEGSGVFHTVEKEIQKLRQEKAS